MDGASRTFGVGPTVQICGETFKVDGKILENYAELEAEILSRRTSPVNQVMEMAEKFTGSNERLAAMMGILLDRSKDWYMVSSQDLASFTNTLRGTIMQIWFAIRANDRARLTLDEVTKLVCRHAERGGDLNVIRKAISQASAEDVVGN